MPEPTKMALLRGAKRGKKRAKSEVSPSDESPRPVDWQDAEAKLCWSHTTAMLSGMGLLSQTDQSLLVRYCQAWARWVRAEKFLSERGDVYPIKDDAGRVKCLQQFPQVAIASKLSLMLLRMEQDMGLTPAARARLAGANSATPAPETAESEFFTPLRIAQ